MLALVALLAAGCGSDYWFEDDPGAEAAVTTPSGIQSGPVRVAYTLTGDMPTSAITVTFSTDGSTFRDATEGAGSDGTANLTVSPTGASHVFIWDSGADLPGARERSVVVRIRPEDGSSVKSEPFAVQNARLLAAVEDAAAGSARLYRLDALDGSLSFLEAAATGGTDPHDVFLQGGFFLIAHATSNSVAVLKLDETGPALAPVAGSPFACDGTGSKHLAGDGSRVFVSNTDSETISIFNLDATTGVLTRATGSGVAAAGCRGLAVVSGRLYVASETTGAILILDIGSGGTLAANAASPVTSGGLVSPRVLAAGGSRLYAAGPTGAVIAGFSVLDGGALSPLGGSPFPISATGLEDLHLSGTKLLGVSGAGATLVSLTSTALGGLAEDSGSPFTLDGPSFGVKIAGKFAVAATTTSKNFSVFSIDAAGALAPVSTSPSAAGAAILRFAVTD